MFFTITVIVINLFFLFFFFKTLSKKSLLIEFSGGRWWLTHVSAALPILIIQLSSVFYATGESFKYLGYHSVLFILLASVFYNYISSRYIEISEIMSHHKINGEGIFGFTNLVLGSTVSFIFSASFVVTYILTICISAVSAIGNNIFLFSGNETLKIVSIISLIWLIALVEILGIKISQKILFYFLGALLVLLGNIILFSIISLTPEKIRYFSMFLENSSKFLAFTDPFRTYGFIIFGLSINVLFFNGLETVISNSNYVRNWRLNLKSYFLITLISLITIPIISIFIFSYDLNLQRGDIYFLPYYAMNMMGGLFGFILSLAALVLLSMVIKICFNNIADALNIVSKKIKFTWLNRLNKRSSFYRIHIVVATFASVIVLVLQSSQQQLAELLAFGILINISFILFTLLVYRYFKGSKEISIFNTSKAGTIFLFTIVFCSVIYLFVDKVTLTFLWIMSTALIFLILYNIFKRKTLPTIERKNLDNPMDLIFHLSEIQSDELQIYFVRPKETLSADEFKDAVFINFCSPIDAVIPKMMFNHFRFPYLGSKLLSSMIAVIELLKYEIPDKKLQFHFGWPLSSWLDRLSIGVMVFSMMKLPKLYPNDLFTIEYFSSKQK
jgi:amino acid transporter